MDVFQSVRCSLRRLLRESRRGLDKSRRSTCGPATRRRDALLRQRRRELPRQPEEVMLTVLPSLDTPELLDPATLRRLAGAQDDED
jgi:hypothetical protein